MVLSVQDPDHARDIVPDTEIDDCGIETAIFVDSGIDLAVSGLNAREIRRVKNNVSALFGERVDVIPFYLDEQRQSQHMEKTGYKEKPCEKRQYYGNCKKMWNCKKYYAGIARRPCEYSMSQGDG